jgi:hypothetical protein
MPCFAEKTGVCCCCCRAQGAHRLLLKTTNIKMGVRLGLLNQDHSKALIFEVDSAKMKGELGCCWRPNLFVDMNSWRGSAC